jgi:chemotaxis signal transduction protein
MSPPSPQDLTYLSLNLAHRDPILIPSEQVVEIISLSLSALSPVPDIESPVMGVYLWRGEILWVIDGNGLLSGQKIHEHQTRPNIRYSVLIIQEGGEHLGVLVPSVGDLRRLNDLDPSLDSKLDSIVDLREEINQFRRKLSANLSANLN